MGNGVYKYCTPKDKSEYDQGAITLRAKSGVKPKSGKPQPQVEMEVKVNFLQSAIRIFFAREKLKRLRIVNKNFREEFLPTISNEKSNKETEMLIKIRREKTILAEENLKRKFAITNDTKQNFHEKSKTKNATDFRENSEIKFPPVLLKSEKNDIYEGFWKLYGNVFVRNGQGMTYQEDGTRIDGHWVNDEIQSGLIYYPNGKVYEGEIRIVKNSGFANYIRSGSGKLYSTSEKIISGNWINDFLNGQCEEHYIGKFRVRSNFTNGQIDLDESLQTHKGQISYENGQLYNGEFDSKLRKTGYGLMLYPNGDIYEGSWKKDKYHGQGIYFVPSSQEKYNFEKKELNKKSFEIFKWGNGKYTQGIWVDGLLNGEGFITTKDKVTNCIWRFGKLIQSMDQLRNKKISLHDNIYQFLSFSEINTLFKIRNKRVLDHFYKNDFSNLIKLRLMQIMASDIKNYNNLLHPCSTFLIENSDNILNLGEVLFNYHHGISEFIPIVGYKSNGGTVQKRFHYSYLFNPKEKTFYSSNYLIDRKTDIDVSGVFAPFIYEESKFKTGGNAVNNLQIKKQLTIFKQTLDNKEEYQQEGVIVEDILRRAREYSSAYDENFKDYKIEFYHIKVADKMILDKAKSKLGDEKQGYFFSIHQALIQIPMKMTTYTFTLNPVRTLAIYLHTQDDTGPDKNLLENVSNFDFSNINTHEKTLFNIPVLKVHNYSTNEYVAIEFDTQAQMVKNSQSKYLLALVQFSNYNKDNHLLNFKKFYHLGKYISIHLIDQNSPFNYPKTGIEIGSTLFYGQIFHISAEKTNK